MHNHTVFEWEGIANDRQWRIWKQVAVAYFNVPTRILPGGTEENRRSIVRKVGLCAVQFNSRPLEYRAGVLSSPSTTRVRYIHWCSLSVVVDCGFLGSDAVRRVVGGTCYLYLQG